MNRRKIIIICILILLGMIILFSIRIMCLNQISNIISEAILNKDYESEQISKKNIQKILEEIYNYGNIDSEIKSVHCSSNEENWIQRYVWISVYYKTSNSEGVEQFKCYFKINKGKIYITKVGLNIADDGSVTDLD